MQNKLKVEKPEAGKSAKKFLRQLRRAGVRAKPRGLAVERREGASTKEISKAKLMGFSERLNIADEGEIFCSCSSRYWQKEEAGVSGVVGYF